MTGEPPPADDAWAVLGLEPGASPEQVERAWRYTRALYEEGALATYSLLEGSERRACRERVDSAYAVLRARPASAGAGAPAAVIGMPPGGAASVPGPRPAPEVLPDPVTGAALRRFREARGVALPQVAAVSRVPLKTLEDIEEDRLDRLPPAVYLRGFLQEYAREVGLDPRATASSYLARSTAR